MVYVPNVVGYHLVVWRYVYNAMGHRPIVWCYVTNVVGPNRGSEPIDEGKYLIVWC